ncbi:MAG: hypothetical protein OEY49_17615, partial [Candidatus Heimdallarchaeota archaeon]|nr:hypothetical protein [Candidatus Heimdallarchaeota archaeon]
MTEFLNKELFSCSNCNSTNDTNFEGFVVCTDCGTTKTKDYVDYRSSISETENTLQNSIGKSIDFVGSLGSQIGYSSGLLRGTRGSKLSNQVISKYQRLIKFHHNRSRIDGNATHLRTMISFNRVFNSFNLSKDIKNRTLYIYWKHVKSGKKFTNHILLVALCFLQIIREEGEKTPIKFSEVIKRFADFGHRVTNKNILRLAHELDVPLSSQFRKPEDYITRITSQIRLNTEINNKLSKLSLSNDEYVTLLA